MIDLTTKFLGMKMKNPLIASASPLSEDIDKIKEMEQNGIAAVVLHSLFEEQIILQEKKLHQFLVQGTEHYAEALSYFPDVNHYHFVPDEYVEYISRLKQEVNIPIIGSLNGISRSGWVRYGQKIEEAGADALELNVYYIPTQINVSCQKIEQIYIDLLSNLRQNITIPIVVKLSPYFNSIPGIVKKLTEAGANGLSLFNRFYQPDIDLNELSVLPNLELSHSSELRLRLRWVAILYQKINADLAITGGIHTVEDIIKSMLVGANVSMMASVLLEKGIPYIDKLIRGVEEWMRRNGYHTIDEMRGILSQQNITETDAFERANYMKVLQSYRFE